MFHADSYSLYFIFLLFLTLFLISKMYTLRAYEAAFNGIGGKKKLHNHKECSCLLKMNNINHI